MRLLQAVSNFNQVKESLLPYLRDNSRKEIYDFFQADKVSPYLVIWKARPPVNGYYGWLGTVFPMPIVAAIQPVMSPRKWYHYVNNELRPDANDSIAMHIKSQKAYLHSILSDAKAWSQIPLILVHVRREITESISELVDSTFLEGVHHFSYSADAVDKLATDLRQLLTIS
jgi:hypothetical protein